MDGDGDDKEDDYPNPRKESKKSRGKKSKNKKGFDDKDDFQRDTSKVTTNTLSLTTTLVQAQQKRIQRYVKGRQKSNPFLTDITNMT